jgi:hypothetical protein
LSLVHISACCTVGIFLAVVFSLGPNAQRNLRGLKRFFWLLVFLAPATATSGIVDPFWVATFVFWGCIVPLVVTESLIQRARS